MNGYRLMMQSDSGMEYPRVPRLTTTVLVQRRIRTAWLLGGFCLFVLAPGLRRAYATPQDAPSEVPPNPQELLGQADSILQEMSAITGLPIKSPLKKRLFSRDQIRPLLVAKFRVDFTPREIHAEEAALKAFGLIPPEFDLEQFYLDLYTEQAAGYYDPAQKTMFIANWVKPDMQRMVMAHELTHALQDQNYDLERFMRAMKDEDDASNARLAVVEGYAMAAMVQYMIKPARIEQMPSLRQMMDLQLNQDPKQFPVYARAPFFFRYQALFPYAEGVGFVQKGLQIGGWKRLNLLFEKPPVDTQQIFVPQDYYRGLPVDAVTLPASTPLDRMPGATRITENSMGELGYYCLLGQLANQDEAGSISSGWVADRYIIYQRPQPNRFALLARTRWASADAAGDFFDAYCKILAHKYPGLAPDSGNTATHFAAASASNAVVVIRVNNECRFAEGFPPAELKSVAQGLATL